MPGVPFRGAVPRARHCTIPTWTLMSRFAKHGIITFSSSWNLLPTYNHLAIFQYHSAPAVSIASDQQTIRQTSTGTGKRPFIQESAHATQTSFTQPYKHRPSALYMYPTSLHAVAVPDPPKLHQSRILRKPSKVYHITNG